MKRKKGKKLFIFEAMWLREETSIEVVREAWKKGEDASRSISNTASALRSWRNKTFGQFAKEMRECQNKMKGLMEQEQTEEKDPWIPSLKGYKVSSSRPADNVDAPVWVKELIHEGRWCDSTITQILNDEERAAIKGIPLPLHDIDDMWAWKFTKDGTYSVKSGYFQELKHSRLPKIASSSRDDKGVWKGLWRTIIQPKIKTFAWRAMKDGLPVRKNLVARGMQVDYRCPMCGEEEESNVHMLMRCQDARNLWYASPLRIKTEDFNVSSFLEWVIELHTMRMDVKWWNLFWNFAWSLWRRRNLWVFEGQKLETKEMLHKVPVLVCEYEQANNRKGKMQQTPTLENGWKPPDEGVYKINNDAAKLEIGRTGVGAVMHDHQGDVLISTCDTIGGLFEVEVMEALAARHALTISLDSGLRKVILETDNLKLFQCLSKKRIECSTFGVIVKDILKLALNCSFIDFSHGRRGGNKVAHNLAKISGKYMEFRAWMEEVPNEVLDYVNLDI
ncbi:hypothetical protein RDABS01_015554 [Bienertia sinuspersici]